MRVLKAQPPYLCKMEQQERIPISRNFLFIPFLFWILFFFSDNLNAQQHDSILYSVYLVGDAGNALVPNDLLRHLKNEVKGIENAAIIFLGDNIYPKGLLRSRRNSSRYRRELAKIHSQLLVFKEFKGSGYFIPGNHDWRAGKMNGLRSIIHQQEAVDTYVKNNTNIRNKQEGAFFPKKGFPGPVSFNLHDSLKLIMMDSQWWLQKDFFHSVGGGEMAAEHVFPRLDSILADAEANGCRVILAMHHPMYTNGNHARAYNPIRSLYYYTPLRILTVFGLDRAVRQDIPDPLYSEMRRQTLAIMEKYSGIIHSGGHDHNLQFFKGSRNFFVVSGSGSKIHRLYSEKYPILFYNATDHGLMQVDYYSTGEIILKARLAKNNGLQEIYRYRIN